jgi:3-oxoacyl-[acyl-carrier protein] reductase
VAVPRPVAFLAGATGGLGPAIARRLARDGFDLALATRRRAADARRLAAELGELGARTVVVTGDLGREAAARKAIERARRALGRLDALVLAVGDLHLGKPSATTAGDLRAQFASNVELPWTIARAGLPRLRRSPRARIVFFSMAGASALTGKRMLAAHAAARVALLVLARSLAREVASDGIVVAAVAPGVARTARSRREAVEPFLKAVPGGRAVTPEEVAATVSACLSEDAATWSGAEIPAALGFGL